MSLFFSSRRKLELKFANYQRAASLSSQAMGCTAQWKMLLFCAKPLVKESSKFELARPKK